MLRHYFAIWILQTSISALTGIVYPWRTVLEFIVQAFTAESRFPGGAERARQSACLPLPRGEAEQDEPCCPSALAVLIPAGITGSLPTPLSGAASPGAACTSAGTAVGLKAVCVLI